VEVAARRRSRILNAALYTMLVGIILAKKVTSVSNGRTQHQSGSTTPFNPTPGRFTELGVSSDPADINLKRFGELFSAHFELRGIVEKNEIKPPQHFGHAASSTRRHTIGAKRLFRDAAWVTSLSATSECTASGDSMNTSVSAPPISVSIRFHQSSNA
jgi:hypothetical protein